MHYIFGIFGPLRINYECDHFCLCVTCSCCTLKFQFAVFFLRCWVLQTRKATMWKRIVFQEHNLRPCTISVIIGKHFCCCYFVFFLGGGGGRGWGGVVENLGSGRVALTQIFPLLFSCCKRRETKKRFPPHPPNKVFFIFNGLFLTWPEETLTSSTTPHTMQNTHWQ